VGLPVALLSLAVCWLGVTMLSQWMPDRPTELDCRRLNREFQGKSVTVEAAVLPGKLPWNVLDKSQGLPELDQKSLTLVKLTQPGIAAEDMNLVAALPPTISAPGRTFKVFSGRIYGAGAGVRLLVVESAREVKP